MGLLLSGIGSVRQGNFTPDFEIQVLCDIFLIAKCNHMALFVLAVNKGLCATFRTVLVIMTLVNKKSVHTEFFKGNNIVLSALVVELFQLLLHGFF